MSTTVKDITFALIKLFCAENQAAIDALLATAIGIIDEYLTPGADSSLFNEPNFRTTFNGNVSNYLKSEELGKKEFSPCLHDLLRLSQMYHLNKSQSGTSYRTLILDVVTS